MAFSNYDIDWQRLVRWNLPERMHTTKQLKWLYSLVYPIVLIHNIFKKYRKAKLYEIAMNYQVCYLEAFLNDRFDFTQRRIYIDDAETVEQLYLYIRVEEKPVYLYRRSEDKPMYLYLRGEVAGDLSYDFIVWVPTDAVYDEAEMRAMVATKICGKRYKIQTF